MRIDILMQASYRQIDVNCHLAQLSDKARNSWNLQARLMYDILSDLSNEILYMLFIIIINSLHLDEVICNLFMPSSNVYVTLIRYFPA